MSRNGTLPGTRSTSVRFTPPVRSKTIASTETVHRGSLSGWSTANLLVEFLGLAAKAVTGIDGVASRVQRKLVAANLAKRARSQDNSSIDVPVWRSLRRTSASTFANPMQPKLEVQDSARNRSLSANATLGGQVAKLPL